MNNLVLGSLIAPRLVVVSEEYPAQMVCTCPGDSLNRGDPSNKKTCVSWTSLYEELCAHLFSLIAGESAPKMSFAEAFVNSGSPTIDRYS